MKKIIILALGLLTGSVFAVPQGPVRDEDKLASLQQDITDYKAKLTRLLTEDISLETMNNLRIEGRDLTDSANDLSNKAKKRRIKDNAFMLGEQVATLYGNFSRKKLGSVYCGPQQSN